MKKILMICLALVMGLGMCAAAGKPAQKKEVTTVFVTDIDCEHCVKKIMNNVPSLGKGIKDVKVDLPKKEVTVIYDASKNNDENIADYRQKDPILHADNPYSVGFNSMNVWGPLMGRKFYVGLRFNLY